MLSCFGGVFWAMGPWYSGTGKPSLKGSELWAPCFVGGLEWGHGGRDSKLQGHTGMYFGAGP